MNSPNRLAQIEALFHAALAQQPAEREVFLSTACLSDSLLQTEVELLLAAHEQAGSFLGGNTAEDQARRIFALPNQPSEEGQPTAILPNPLLNPEANSAERTLNQYRIISLLGKGGMGEVWLAEDTRLKRKVALKLLPAEFTGDAGRLRRFEQEALAISALNHPNIITIYEISECDAGRFIVMELVTGQTLRAITAESIPTDSLIAWGSQLAKALHVAHAAGITHRDIKPENIMVRTDGYVKVLDFGLARLDASRDNFGEAEPAAGTEPGILLGTVKYMSPEQARGERVTSATDIFALGILFYELATGTHPFNASTLLGTLQQITSETPQSPSRLNPDIPAALESLILRMLEKEPVQRPSASELAETLQEIQQQRSDDSESFRAEPSPSIAVLPFVNISNDPDNEYFCDGLAEELLNALSKIEALHVAARTSSFSFKGKETDIREIGQKLNVGAVLEGSVRKSGNRLRITAQLINITDGYHLWSERYDREMQDIFDIQDEIALSIVAALKVKLLGEEKAAVLKRYTDNTEAYQLYLKGRFHLSKLTEAGYRKALECYEQAITIEPDYAPAFAGIAVVYLNLWSQGGIAPAEAVPQIKAAVANALASDQTLAESHVSLGLLKLLYEWDWEGAEKEFKQALALNPNYAGANRGYGYVLAITGRRVEAVAQADRALELDPLSLLNIAHVAEILFYTGEYDRQLALGRRLIELEPHFWTGYMHVAIDAVIRKDYEQAVSAVATAITLGATPLASYFVGCLYGILGQPEKAEQARYELQKLSAQRYVPYFSFAMIYAGLGELDRAFEWLEKSFEQREGVLIYFKQLSALIPGLSADPRLADLLRRIGLPQGTSK